MFTPNQEILFTRQRHDAKRAGLHYDIRLVAGDKAYSWATKKDLPEVGQAILLYEQPVHDSTYALSKKIIIPDGEYGAGVTTLDYVRKAKLGEDPTPEQFTLYSGKDKFLFKKLDEAKYGKKAWLFKRFGMDKKAEFKPDLTPEQMEAIGVLAERYKTQSAKDGNFFGVVASQKTWPTTWHNDQHPKGWYEWYQNYSKGKRTNDDERQIKRWESFKARHLAQLKAADPSLENLSVQPRRRQALLNWGIAPGIDVDRAMKTKNVNKYLEKIAKYRESEDSHVSTRGKKYKINDLLDIADGIEATKQEVKKYKWQKPYLKTDYSRLQKANLKYPILVDKRGVILDGGHRYVKAHNKGMTHIDVKVIPDSKLKHLKPPPTTHAEKILHRVKAMQKTAEETNERYPHIEYWAAQHLPGSNQPLPENDQNEPMNGIITKQQTALSIPAPAISFQPLVKQKLRE